MKEQDSGSICKKKTALFSMSEKLMDLGVNLFLFIQISIHSNLMQTIFSK